MTYIWETLTHDNILNNLEKTLDCKLTNLFLKRNSYINRVFELERADNKERIIVKFYRPNRWTKRMILEEHSFVNALLQADVPVIPPMTINGQTLFELNDIHYAIYPKKGGRALDEFDKNGWEQIGRLMAKIHLVGESGRPPRRVASSRITWTPETATRKHLQTLLDGKYISPDFESTFAKTVETFINKAEELFTKEENILLHGDCHKGNLIHRPGEGIFFVDFDDICVGPAVQDLWMLLPGFPEESEQEIEWFLNGYTTFREFNEASLALIPALRAMRIIHFSAWCAIQSTEPDFAEHFPEWGSPKYWNGLIKELQSIIYEN